MTFLDRAKKFPRKFGLFGLVRGIAARDLDKPRVGTSKMPSQDVVTLRQVPHLHFPGPTIEKIDQSGDAVTVDGYWLGLTGPMSPLPLHLTEFAILEHKSAKKRPFGDFLHLLTGRFLQFFYRAWADSQPVVHADRPEDDQFAYYLGQLSGAHEGAKPDSAFPAQARLHYAALFTSPRSAGAIEGALRHLLGMSVEVNEFLPRWRPIEREDRTRLGTHYNQLGDVILGEKVFQASDSFEAKITAKNAADFNRLLPTGSLFAVAAEALTALAPTHLDWMMTVCLPQSEIPQAKLDGGARLGWSSWVGKTQETEIRSDVHLRGSAVTALA
ncbi:MAG: type VI secretion system baseplate subunit TssG [Hellea sp.]|nr:type VI secretion system baseplate subunit TssG [Hellea sp.]